MESFYKQLPTLICTEQLKKQSNV